MLRLARSFLKAGVMRETGGLEKTVTGTPQGGIASPLLANVALTALDRQYEADWRRMSWHGSSRQALRRKGYPTYRLVRFADLCGYRHRSAYAERRVMPSGCGDPCAVAVGNRKSSA